MSQTLGNSIRTRLERVSKAEFVLVAAVSALVASLTVILVAYRIGYFDGQMKCGYPCTGSGHKDIFVNTMRLRIAIALAAASVGILVKRTVGLILSLISLMVIELCYIYWYLNSLRWLQEAGLENFSQLPSQTDIPNTLGFYGGVRWDLFVFGVATVLLLWQLRLLSGALQLRSAGKRTVNRQS